MSFRDIAEEHLHRIVKMDINKEEEGQHKDRVTFDWQAALTKFYTH